MSLASILQIPSELITQHLLDGMNTSVVSKAVPFEGQIIRFTHQLWRIDPRSVCFDQYQDATRHSRCTQSAKKLFTLLCQQVDHDRYRNMYCRAAAQYQPVIAEVSDYGRDDPNKADIKRRCGDLRLEAMGDKGKVAERDRVCSEFEGME
ncbi:hypothetical protein [Gallaecimonas sp. GXIMD4217]|uniref:hypothetical protein n=1 Tax=Gallaecimonas sp. GXIMD4217 TaxID=3131927 RepID=UPI00311B0017